MIIILLSVLFNKMMIITHRVCIFSIVSYFIYNLDSGDEIVFMNLRNAIYSLINDRKPCARARACSGEFICCVFHLYD